MKIFYIGILKRDCRPAIELCSVTELSSVNVFVRGNYAEFFAMFSKTFAERTKKDQRTSTEDEGSPYTFHTYDRSNKIAGVVISDKDYPSRVAHQLLHKVVEEFVTKHPQPTYEFNTKDSPKLAFPELKAYIKTWQDPESADPITKIQKELDETKIVLNKTIESVLERGEKIDSLVAKSDDLSNQSKAFYGQAKKQNSCCVVM